MGVTATRTGITRTTAPAALVAAVLVCVLVCMLPGRALASTTMQTSLMDDNELIYASPSQVSKNLTQIRSMGIDEIKVSVVWSLIAPDSKSQTEPNFDATDPSAYPAHAWDRWDLVDRLAAQLGLQVYFQIVPPAPAWAVAQSPPTPPGYSWSQRPNPFDYQQFVQAVGTRYSGSFETTVPKSEPVPTLLGIPLPILAPPPSPGVSSPLPRVDVWGVWNEPNEAQWLNPQTVAGPNHHPVALAPSLYRQLVDGAYAGLRASGHAHDTILIGETASIGATIVTSFVRDLYCVGRSNLPLRGAAAAALACPRSGSAASFVAAHPGLFKIGGFAHHPYSFDQPPTRPLRPRGSVTLENLPGFARTLDQIFQAYGRRAGLPIYVTEFGYKTNPPNPFVKTSLTQQETWLNEAEYIAWKDPRIVSMNQFLLADALPRTGAKPGTLSYWSTFQTGLEYADGTHKPSYAAFEIPIWLPRAHTGPSVVVWGQLRPADHTTTQTGMLQFQARNSSTWTTLESVQTTNPRGFLEAHVALTAPGSLRLAWADPATGDLDLSRAVNVS